MSENVREVRKLKSCLKCGQIWEGPFFVHYCSVKPSQSALAAKGTGNE